MTDRNEIVCICGSARFAREIRDVNRELSHRGIIVLAPCEIEGPIEDHLKAVLDELHIRKINLADRILVVNPGGYVGESTRREIAHARATGKPVAFSSPA